MVFDNTVDPLPGQQDLKFMSIMDINANIVELNKTNNVPSTWIT